jgi:RNA polymerase sigma-70 factor, ECF subfamily
MTDRPRIEEFVRLFTGHEARLRGFAISLIPHWADAEEVMQQASMAMWTKFDEFQSGTNFFAWASRIVYLEAMRFRQKQARGRVRFSDAFCRAVAKIAVDASDDLADREQALSDCLAKLKPDERELIRRRYEEGGSVEALATALGRTEDAIYAMLRRIRRQLFECITRTLRAGKRYAT